MKSSSGLQRGIDETRNLGDLEEGLDLPSGEVVLQIDGVALERSVPLPPEELLDDQFEELGSDGRLPPPTKAMGGATPLHAGVGGAEYDASKTGRPFGAHCSPKGRAFHGAKGACSLCSRSIFRRPTPPSPSPTRGRIVEMGKLCMQSKSIHPTPLINSPDGPFVLAQMYYRTHGDVWSDKSYRTPLGS